MLSGKYLAENMIYVLASIPSLRYSTELFRINLLYFGTK